MKKILLLAVLLAGAVLAGRAWAQQAKELEPLTSRSYASVDKNDVTVVMFTASYCRPCRAAKEQLFPALMAKYAQDKNVRFYTLDVEHDSPAVNGTFLKDVWGVTALPTFVVVQHDAVMFSKRGFSDQTAVKIRQDLEARINALK